MNWKPVPQHRACSNSLWQLSNSESPNCSYGCMSVWRHTSSNRYSAAQPTTIFIKDQTTVRGHDSMHGLYRTTRRSIVLVSITTGEFTAGLTVSNFSICLYMQQRGVLLRWSLQWRLWQLVGAFARYPSVPQPTAGVRLGYPSLRLGNLLHRNRAYVRQAPTRRYRDTDCDTRRPKRDPGTLGLHDALVYLVSGAGTHLGT